MTQNDSKPIKDFRSGPVQASIWRNEVEKDGRSFRIRKVVFQKRYKDGNGEWRTSQSLDENDIPKAILALADAYDYLTGGEQDEDGDS